jgi:hypothetical protein
MLIEKMKQFVEAYMRQHGRLKAARLQAALALLEKLRSQEDEKPSLNLDDHLTRKGSSGIKSQENWGRIAHERFSLKAIRRTHGRRASDIGVWGPVLLDILKAEAFATAAPQAGEKLIHEAQQSIAAGLRQLLDEEPLCVSIRGRSAESVIGDILAKADAKGMCGDVAQYLVGAKLRLRFGWKIEPVPANKKDRASSTDIAARRGDYDLKEQNVVLEVAMGTPDDKHIDQIAEALDESDAEIWLLVRADRMTFWKSELEKTEDIDTRRVVVASVESFVGQNITELAEFSPKRKSEKLTELFRIYNDEWMPKVGTPGIRIEIK